MMKWAGFKSVAHASRVVVPCIEVLEERRLLSIATASDVPSIVQLPRSAHAEAAQPSVNSTTPADGALNVDPRVYVVAYVNLPNVGGVTDDPATLAANVRLVRTGDEGAAPI